VTTNVNVPRDGRKPIQLPPPLYQAQLRWCERALDYGWNLGRSLAIDSARIRFEAATASGCGS
jgi:hypothetical protein